MIALHHQFTVDLSVEETWALLTDLPKVAQCMPGAGIDEVVDGEYRGGLSTRIGPISAKYKGTAVFREHDEVGHHAVIEARGREEKGSGSASALITTHLKPDESGTLVDVSTELAISGKAAQFGRSLLTEVSNSIVDDFVRRLEAMIAAGEAGTSDASVRAGASTSTSPASSTGRAAAASSDEGEASLDMFSTVAAPLLRKAAVPAVAALVAGVLGVLLGRRGRSRTQTGGIPVTYVLPYPSPSDRTPFGL